jgi:hypothetical protein
MPSSVSGRTPGGSSGATVSGATGQCTKVRSSHHCVISGSAAEPGGASAAIGSDPAGVLDIPTSMSSWRRPAGGGSGRRVPGP